jgi:c-di-GMP-related signal transduction protein
MTSQVICIGEEKLMDVFIARQPIFDVNQKVYAYELLYRSGTENISKFKSGDSATSNVVINALLLIGPDTLTEGNRAFINFTETLIKDEIPKMFSNEYLVVELLEDIVPDAHLILRVRELKALGYTIALDDYIASYEYDELAELADIIKVDFVDTTLEERAVIAKNFRRRNKVLLAEKVETKEEFQEAKALGFSLFQGYFFSKPSILKGKDVASLNISYLEVIRELDQPEPQYDKMAEIIERDVALTFKLLRLINSAAFFTSSKVASVKQALVLLGFKEIRKWVMVIMLRDVGKSKPDEVLKTCLVRAKMAEQVAIIAGMKIRKNEMFIMGLFSMIDTLMDQDLYTIIDSLPLEDDIKAAMVGKKNKLYEMFMIVMCYEKGNWEQLLIECGALGIVYSEVPDIYYDSLKWADMTYSRSLAMN